MEEKLNNLIQSVATLTEYQRMSLQELDELKKLEADITTYSRMHLSGRLSGPNEIALTNFERSVTKSNTSSMQKLLTEWKQPPESSKS